MATITNLDVNLLARTQKFDGPIKKSGAAFGRFSGGFKSFNPAGFLVKLAGIAGALALIRTGMRRVNEQFGKIDKITKLSDDVGATVKDFQALHLQAELTGTSTETLDKGMKRFVRTLGDARAGESEAIDGLAQLGFTANDFDGLSLTQQVGLVSDKIQGLKNPADQASAAFAVFGRQGQELLTFFKGGSEGIQAAADDIDRFGVGLTRVDGAQIEQANDAFTRLGVLVDGVFQKIAVEAAPILTAMVEMFTGAAVEAGGFGTIVETGFAILIEGIAIAMNGWNIMRGGILAVQTTFKAMQTFVIGGLAAIEAALIAIGGQRFDFGLDQLHKDLIKETVALGKESIDAFGEGFSGSAGQAFKDKIAQVKADAVKIAEIAEEAKVLPEKTGPGFFSAFRKGLGDVFKTAGSFLKGLELPPLDVEAGPSVGALLSGSSAALSAIIQGQQGNNDPAIKAAQMQIAATEKQTKELTKNQTVAIVVDDPFI